MKDVQFNVYNVESMLSQPPERFEFIRFDPNNNCNVHCVYCHNHRSNAIVETEQLESFLGRNIISTEGFQMGCIMEPTLDKRMTDLMLMVGQSEARPRRQFVLQTNGILLHTHDHAKMIDAGLTELSVSVDSADATKHKILRGGTSLDKVSRNVRNFIAKHSSVKVIFITTVTAANVFDLVELVQLGTDMGVRAFVLREMFHLPESDVVDHDRVRNLIPARTDFDLMRDQITDRFGRKVELNFIDNGALEDHRQETKLVSFR